MSTPFSPGSRYRGVPVRTRVEQDGSQVQFVGRRIIPPTSRFQALDRHLCEGDERADRLAADFYGDPEQYWRICDANAVAEPAETAKSEGRVLIIPLPLEVSGHGDA
nr:hypothetical protein [uncultured Sphingomonas sp.]